MRAHRSGTAQWVPEINHFSDRHRSVKTLSLHGVRRERTYKHPRMSITGLKLPGPLVFDTNSATNWKIWYRVYKHDDDIDKLKEYIQKGWPTNKYNVPNQLIPYIPHKDDLMIQNGLIMKENRVLIPKALHNKMIDILHETHLGITKTKLLAREPIFWPNIYTQITLKIEQCSTCQKTQKTNTQRTTHQLLYSTSTLS